MLSYWESASFLSRDGDDALSDGRLFFSTDPLPLLPELLQGYEHRAGQTVIFLDDLLCLGELGQPMEGC